MKNAVLKHKVSNQSYTSLVFTASYEEVKDIKPGCYIKICINESEKVLMRTVTVSEILSNGKEFKVDIVNHKNNGPLALWKNNLKQGDQISYKGPGKVSILSYDAESIFAFCDLTSLPALRAHLLNIKPKHSEINLFTHENPDFVRNYCQNIKIHFLNNEEFLKKIDDSELNKSSLWIAGERNQIHNFRKLLSPRKNEFLSFYMSSYWHEGLKDEEHKVIKKQDSLVISS